MRDYGISRFEASRNFRCEIFESRDFLSISRYYHLAINETRFPISRFFLFCEVLKSRDFLTRSKNLEIFYSSRCISRFSRLEFYFSRFSRLNFPSRHFRISSRIFYLEIFKYRLEFFFSRDAQVYFFHFF